MKKIISVFALVACVAAMCVAPVYAAGGLTLSSSAVTANKGDEIILSTTLDTTQGLKTLGLKIAFDLDDFELGVSDESKAIAAEYADYIGTPEYPTLDAVTMEAIGRASYVDDTYANTYASYASNKNLGAATIDYEEKDGFGYVTFGYAIATAKGSLNKLTDMAVGGIVLNAKTADKKEAKITIEEATYSGADGVDTPCVSNEIAIALNGYGTDPKAEVAALEDGGDMYGMKTKVAKVTTNGAEVSKAKVTLGDEFKYYDLPAGVSGTADFIAIIRYAASLGNPAFTLSVE